MLFGEFVKEQRVESGLSLREFCKSVGEDPSNWSKVERGILKPPIDPVRLDKMAKVLGIMDNKSKYEQLVSAASIDSGKIPDYIMRDEYALNLMPLFFRTIGGGKPTEEELKELFNQIKRGGLDDPTKD